MTKILERSRKISRIIAFASGKGGVGKTVCTANLAYHLADHHNVLTVDLDLGCGNLNASLGIRTISYSINDFITGHFKTLAQLKTATPSQKLQFISCSYNPIEKTLLTPEQKQNLLDSFRADDADYVLLDLGAGVNEDILDFFAAADVRVLVTAPESLALHNAFVFVKSLVFRVVVKSLEQCGLPKRTRDNIIRQLYSGGDQEIGKTIERIRAKNRVAGDFIRAVVSGIKVHVILNRAQSVAEEKFITNLQQLTQKTVHIDLNYLGAIPLDENVKRSLNELVPFALEYSRSPANGAFGVVAAALNQHLSDMGFLESGKVTAARPGTVKRLGMLVEGKLGTGLLRSQSSADRELIRDYEVTIKEFSKDLNLARAIYNKGKRDWRKEKSELEDKVSNLETELASTKQRHLRSEKKLEESLVRRDEAIEKLQQEIRTLKEILERRQKVGF